ncbi:PIN domain-containing protein [Candidatus Saccharibacteria bacterium]|nr:PIN domain-containing protein [Candidatus Saccharibacteria bacterium]
MTSSLDTNILLRYIWKDVPGQREKAAELLNTPDKMFYISDLVVSELVYNLQLDDLRRSSIVGVLYELFARKNVISNPFLTELVLPFYAEHPALSFVDCYTAFEAEEKNRAPLWTFDKKLANQHKSAELVR